MNTSNISSSSTSSLTSIMISTPPYSGKDVVSTSSSAACINHPKHIKQTRQVSWGLSDEIIVVSNDDDNIENQKDIASTAVPDSGGMVMFPSRPIERRDVFTMSTHFANSARIDGSTGNCSSSNNNNNNYVAAPATTYHELEEQYRLNPRQSPPTERIDNRYMTFPFHSFVNFRTKGDDYDDDSSCFTDIKDDEVVYMDEDKNRHDLDGFHRYAYHQHGVILYDNVNDDDDDDDEILQTPDHTLHYYYNPNSQQRYPSS